LVRKPEERVYFKDLGVDEIILILTFGERDGAWNGLIWQRIGTSGEIL
jgi:hypothetical protein